MKAPFSWPNSSDAIRSRGSAPVCTATNGPFARVERKWTARATSSLPVPDSPVISTVASACAASLIFSNTLCMTRERAIIPSKVISPERPTASSLLGR